MSEKQPLKGGEPKLSATNNPEGDVPEEEKKEEPEGFCDKLGKIIIWICKVNKYS